MTQAVPGEAGAVPADLEAALGGEARRLFAIAYSVLRNSEDARDAVQEALTRAWLAWDDLRDPQGRSRWITRICVHECLTLRRRLLARRDGDELTEASGRTAPAQTDTFMLHWDRSFRRLAPRQRAVVILHYQWRYSLDECAVLMGCRPGAARQHLARALAHLRKETTHA